MICWKCYISSKPRVTVFLFEIVIETVKLISTRSLCAIFFYQSRIHRYIITCANILARRNLNK